MSENYCPSCGLQKIYGRTLAYYPDGPDLNKNICSKCGQTLMSADATIATLTRENEALRKERDEHQKRGEENALAQTPTQQLIAKLRECEPAMALKQGNVAYLEALDTLKNSNPTVIAMLERAIGALENVRDLMTKDNYLSGVGITAYVALAHLDALAREALKERTDGKA